MRRNDGSRLATPHTPYTVSVAYNMKKRVINRIDGILDQIKVYESRINRSPMNISGAIVNSLNYDVELYQEIKSSCSSLILSIYGENHPYFTDFQKSSSKFENYKNISGILKAVKFEIENDWLLSMKSLLSAEIFSDFLEMGEYLLNENYKDAAAVMIGSVLEEHLRQLSLAAKNDLTNSNGRPKKASLLNAELVKLNVYNKLDEKNITAWLDLRNKAAHGKYSEYKKEQVDLMLNSVRDFIVRIPIKI